MRADSLGLIEFVSALGQQAALFLWHLQAACKSIDNCHIRLHCGASNIHYIHSYKKVQHRLKISSPGTNFQNKMAETKAYTLEELKEHTTESDCWLAIHGKVYNVTDFLDEHPGEK